MCRKRKSGRIRKGREIPTTRIFTTFVSSDGIGKMVRLKLSVTIHIVEVIFHNAPYTERFTLKFTMCLHPMGWTAEQFFSESTRC